MKQIAALLHVSASSVSLWTRDIELTAEQRTRNMKRARSAAADKWIAKHRHRRLQWQQEGRERARLGDPLHQAGCMLYWAEGTKDRNQLDVANSDVNMAQLFLRFLRDSLAVTSAEVKISLNVYTGNGLSLRQIEDYWREALGLPRTCLRAHRLNHKPTSSSGNRKNRLPYGVCDIRVSSTRIVQHIYGAIQEYGGFNDPRWLDGPPVKNTRRSER